MFICYLMGCKTVITFNPYFNFMNPLSKYEIISVKHEEIGVQRNQFS